MANTRFINFMCSHAFYWDFDLIQIFVIFFSISLVFRWYIHVRWCSQRIDETTPNGPLVWWATVRKWSRRFSYVGHKFRSCSHNTGTHLLLTLISNRKCIPLLTMIEYTLLQIRTSFMVLSLPWYVLNFQNY